MTTQEILEFNRLCAEFLGAECISPKTKYSYFDFGEDWNTGFPFLFQQKVHSNMLKFHSDWNWIMEVVEAIEKLKLGNVRIPITFSSMYQPTKTEIQEYYDASVVFNIAHSNCTVDIIGTMRLCEGFIVVDNLTTKKGAVVQAINQFLIWYNKNNK